MRCLSGRESQHITPWVSTPRRAHGGGRKSTRYSPWRRVMVDPIANGTNIDIPVLNRGRRPGVAGISTGSQPLRRAWPDHRAHHSTPRHRPPTSSISARWRFVRALRTSKAFHEVATPEQQLVADNPGRSRGGSIAGPGIAPDRLADYIVASPEPIANCPQTPCVLVRPNGHVVWRCLAAGPDGPQHASDASDRALGSVPSAIPQETPCPPTLSVS